MHIQINEACISVHIVFVQTWHKSHTCTLPVWLHLSLAGRSLWPTQRFHNRMRFWIPPAKKPKKQIKSVSFFVLFVFSLCVSVLSVPCTGQSSPTWKTWSPLGWCRWEVHPGRRSIRPQEKCAPVVCQSTSSAVREAGRRKREANEEQALHLVVGKRQTHISHTSYSECDLTSRLKVAMTGLWSLTP